LTKYFLRKNDTYQVEDAEDGLIGFEKLKNNDYLVLCDMQNAKMDGVEVLEAVEKSNQKFPW
jgi:CheY-like chemotaxis protein